MVANFTDLYLLILFPVLSSDQRECFGKERFAEYFERKMLSIELIRAAFAEELELTPSYDIYVYSKISKNVDFVISKVSFAPHFVVK